MATGQIKVRFWGVRGSLPAPLVGADVEAKVASALVEASAIGNIPTSGNPAELKAWIRENLGFVNRATIGGNTTCVEVRCGQELIVLDMGSGVRPLGNALIGEMFAKKEKGIHGTFLQSHVHWDHIQGFPFFGPVYMDRRKFDNRFRFYGGKEWDRSLESVLHGQMVNPVFPVDMKEIEQTGIRMEFHTVYDGLSITLGEGADEVKVLCRKLFHPQETYGYRIEYKGEVFVFTTDHEPLGAGIPDGLTELVKGADQWVTDCQYTQHQYEGKDFGNIKRHNWGHSYPEYIAEVAKELGVQLVYTTHHDPGADDSRVLEIARQVERLSGVTTVAAYEGLSVGF